MSERIAKTGDNKTDKAIKEVVSQVKKKQAAVKVSKGVIKSQQMSDGEISITEVPKGTELPGSPNTDEGRLYFKINGNLYKLTGVKVG
tara:strand:- start:468 stop:731 length:264 start_codon:yes stop_codon:yes gene_type:complete